MTAIDGLRFCLCFVCRNARFSGIFVAADKSVNFKSPRLTKKYCFCFRFAVSLQFICLVFLISGIFLEVWISDRLFGGSRQGRVVFYFKKLSEICWFASNRLALCLVCFLWIPLGIAFCIASSIPNQFKAEQKPESKHQVFPGKCTTSDDFSLLPQL